MHTWLPGDGGYGTDTVVKGNHFAVRRAILGELVAFGFDYGNK
jgi:hypothetical protein